MEKKKLSITFGQVFGDAQLNARNALARLRDGTPWSGRILIGRVTAYLAGEQALFQKHVDAIVDKQTDLLFAEMKKASPAGAKVARPERGAVIQFPGFQNEYQELLAQKCELECEQVPLSMLGDNPALSGAELAALDWLFLNDLDDPVAGSDGGLTRKDKRAQKKKT